MINGYIFFYNIKDLMEYDIELIEASEKINFHKIMKGHFSDLKEVGNHNTIMRENLKIYYGWKKNELANYLEVQYTGKKALEELMKIGKSQNWSIMSLDKNKKLINLNL